MKYGLKESTSTLEYERVYPVNNNNNDENNNYKKSIKVIVPFSFFYHIMKYGLRRNTTNLEYESVHLINNINDDDDNDNCKKSFGVIWPCYMCDK